jgi:hypothetical protein
MQDLTSYISTDTLKEAKIIAPDLDPSKLYGEWNSWVSNNIDKFMINERSLCLSFLGFCKRKQECYCDKINIQKTLEPEIEAIKNSMNSILGELIVCMSNIGVVIRNNTSYNQSNNIEFRDSDILNFSELLSELKCVGNAIINNDSKEIIDSCDHLLSYRLDRTSTVPDIVSLKDSFKRWDEIISHENVCIIIENIKSSYALN